MREYDAETGGLAKVSKESGGSVIGALNYAYNNTGALASISWLGRSVVYDYDKFGRMKTARANEADWEYTYAPCGKKATVHNTRANEMETREYDGLGRQLSIEHKNANDNRIIFRINYRLGPDGNRVGAFERRQTATDDIATSWSYTYDPLGRLIRERRSINEHYGTNPNTFTQDRDTSYEYDRDSNRTMVTDHQPTSVSIEKYAYVSNTQRLYQVITGGGYKQYSWTQNGEMAREDNYTGGSFDETETYYVGGSLNSSQIYTWGIGGVLSEVRFEGGDQDGCKVNYEYDSDNELIGRKVTLKNGTVTEKERYLVDHQNPTGYSQRFAVLDTLTGAIRHEIFTDELVAETTVNSGTSNTQFPHADALGSIRALTGQSAAGENLNASAERHFYDYTAFGSSLRGDRSLTSYAFTSQVSDPVSKFQYHRARWLNVKYSSWLSGDRLFDFEGNYGSTYNYVGSDPVNKTDLTGRGSDWSLGGCLIAMAIIGIIGAAIGGHLGGIRGAIIGFVAGAAIGGLLYTGVMGEVLGLGLALLASALTTIIAIYAHLSGIGKGSIPISSQGYIHYPVKDSKGEVFISFANDDAITNYSGGTNQFSPSRARDIAELLTQIGYSVTYGRPRDEQEFTNTLGARKYDIIYILGHGTIGSESGTTVIELVGPPADPAAVANMVMIGRAIRGRPKLVFIDGCNASHGNQLISCDHFIGSTTDIIGAPADAAFTFFAIWRERHDVQIPLGFKQAYDDVYGANKAPYLWR